MELILAVASQLIVERGSGPLKMNEIADLAGMSIGSLYRYFPDKRAVIRTLAEQHAAESRRCIAEALAPVQTKAELAAAFSALVDQYHALLRDTPLMRDLAFGMRADKELAAIELAESRACGALLADAIRRAHPKADAKKVDVLAFLVWQLGEETMRLALASKRGEAAQLVEAYKRMSLRAIEPPFI
jgi:AcrR family transcriptional regulator